MSKWNLDLHYLTDSQVEEVESVVTTMMIWYDRFPTMVAMNVTLNGDWAVYYIILPRYGSHKPTTSLLRNTACLTAPLHYVQSNKIWTAESFDRADGTTATHRHVKMGPGNNCIVRGMYYDAVPGADMPMLWRFSKTYGDITWISPDTESVKAKINTHELHSDLLALYRLHGRSTGDIPPRPSVENRETTVTLTHRRTDPTKGTWVSPVGLYI